METDGLPTDNSGMMVTVAYRGFFDDGSVFMEVGESAPISFPCLDGWMPPAFIDTVRTMVPGQVETVHVGADEAYEQHTDERVKTVPRSGIPKGVRLVVGEMVNLETPSGQTYPARLIELTEDNAVFDMNHEAICKALNFEIRLLAVEELC